MKTTKNFFVATAFILVCAGFCAAKEYTAEQIQEMRKNVVSSAKQYIGCDYQTGAIGPDKFDCSGLIYTVMRDAAGIQMPRSVKAIYSKTKIIKAAEVEEGDLVFFKTTGDGSISHVGIYIGKNQFIHAASDGANTGVIVSSLKEKYYAGYYAGMGKILPSTKTISSDDSEKTENDDSKKKPEESETAQEGKSTKENATAKKNNSAEKALSKIIFDASLFCDWAFYYPQKFKFNWRGAAFETNIRYDGGALQPGFGMGFRWNEGTKSFQIPLVLSLTIKNYFKFYLGPVIHCSTPTMPNSETKIKGPFFPGIIGFSVQTPSLKIGVAEFALVQDVFYTFYRNADGKNLSFKNATGTGIVFSSGIRVTLPGANFFK